MQRSHTQQVRVVGSASVSRACYAKSDMGMLSGYTSAMQCPRRIAMFLCHAVNCTIVMHMSYELPELYILSCYRSTTTCDHVLLFPTMSETETDSDAPSSLT